jgi:hypothetical protein
MLYDSDASATLRRVTTTLEELRWQRAFQHLAVGKARDARIPYRMLWHYDRVYRFVLDLEAGAVIFPSILPATLPPQLLRELKWFLRTSFGLGQSSGAQLDRQRGELRVFVQHGALTLSITVTNDAYEYCTQFLVRLAEEVLVTFLKQPTYLNYRTSFLTQTSIDTAAAHGL